MTTAHRKDNAPIGIKSEIADRLPAKHLKLTENTLDGYYKRLVGGAAQKADTADRSIRAIQDFIAFSGKAPWLCTEDDFNAWCFHLGVVRQCVSNTQRIYQTAVRAYYNYLTANPLFSNLIREMSGVTVKQVSFQHNSIVHKFDNTGRSARDAVSVTDFNAMLAGFDEAILDAVKFRSKSLHPLIRDKVLFFLMEDGGLRADEALGTDLCDFTDDPRFPQYGNFACVSVLGKGGKTRTVHIENPLLPALLEYYVEHSRPRMLKPNNPNETAFFLSERGRRMGYGSLWARYQNALALADLDTTPREKRLTPHSLRHSSITNGAMNGRSVEATRLKSGHAFASTGQVYSHVPDSFVGDEIYRSIRKNQKRYEETLNKP